MQGRNGDLLLHKSTADSSPARPTELQFCWELLICYPEGAGVQNESGMKPLQCLWWSAHSYISAVPTPISLPLPEVYPFPRCSSLGREDLLREDFEANWTRALLLIMAFHIRTVPAVPNKETIETLLTRPLSLVDAGLPGEATMRQSHQFFLAPLAAQAGGPAFLPLHAALAPECPSVLATSILLQGVYSDQLAVQDSRCRLPLHWAAGSSIIHKTFFYTHCAEYKDERSWYEHRLLVLHLFSFDTHSQIPKTLSPVCLIWYTKKTIFCLMSLEDIHRLLAVK